MKRPRSGLRPPDAVVRQLPSADGPLRAGRFDSPLHDTRVAAWLGIGLGVCFSVCFVTGIYSHLEQHPPSWWDLPPRPAGLYRVTQGLHVATGLASVPLLLAKLWTVWPRFVAYPPLRSIAHAVERLSLIPLVGGSLFQVVTGVCNIAQWYWFRFFFTTAHDDMAYVVIGALIVHVGAKFSTTRDVVAGRGHFPRLSRHPEPGPGPGPEPEPQPTGPDRAPAGMTRRGFLLTVGAASAVLTAATVGETVSPLRSVDLLGPRRSGVGPQGVPVNRSAVAAGVAHLPSQVDTYRLVVEGAVSGPMHLTLADLRAMPQHQARLPIACVDGWSTNATWSGVRVRDLLAAAGAPPGRRVTVESLERRGAYRRSTLNHEQAHDPDCLLALHLGGEVLDPDHGFPVRLIAPNRPGVLNTKWVGRLVVS